jgi:uncharacterized protein (TIGR02444 family)
MNTGEDFWAFSVRVYSKPDVPPACLALQNDYGLDVNLLLYCCWLGTHGAQLEVAALAQALAFADPWSEHVVRPLRHARTWMKHDSDARGRLPSEDYTGLRESIKTIELEAERLQQLTLEAMMPDSVRKPAGTDEAVNCVSNNLLLYASEAGITLDAELRSQLATIISASTGGEPAQAVHCLTAGDRSGAGSTDG